MWLSVDPMWEKYAGMSPYNYCAGNPVNLVDPDGRDVRVKPDNTSEGFEYTGYVENTAEIEDEYVRNTVLSLNEKYLNNDPELMRAINSKIKYSIMPRKYAKDNSNQFDASTQTIYWDWNRGMIHYKDSEIMVHSSSSRLSHELSHLEDYDIFMTARKLSDIKDMILETDLEFVSKYFNNMEDRQKLMNEFGPTIFKGNQGEDKAVRTEFKVGKRLNEFTGKYSRPEGKYNQHNLMPIVLPSVFLNKDEITNFKQLVK